jgi:predicted amidohydrolase YtcJ
MADQVDLIIMARQIHAMRPHGATYRSLAIAGERIVAISEDPDGLDGLRDSRTRVIAEPGLTLLPAIFDDHEHLLDASHNLSLVQPQQARSINGLIELIRKRASVAKPGQWIVTAAGWDESALMERRLPTAVELDRATDAHPVLCPRGGHVCVANSLALRLAQITPETPAPRGGTTGHDDEGRPTGLLEGSSAQMIKSLVPPVPEQERIAELDRGCRAYASLGIGGVREALLREGELAVYRRAWERGLLPIRCRPMLLIDSRWPLQRCLDYIESIEPSEAWGDDWLRTWGLKFVADGGVAGAATEEPFADAPNSIGHLNWDQQDFAAAVEFAVACGWRVATHAVGDRAVRSVLDAYESVVARRPGLAPRTLAIEHAMLAPAAQRTRAVRLGVAITVQHNLLYTYGREMVERWGPQRAAASLPVRSWLRDGAIVSAGSDAAHPVNPMLTLWGLVTRGTADAGVQGPEEAISRERALELMTVASVALTGDLDRRGTLEPGKLADLVAYEQDPLTAPLDDLPQLVPALTMVGGRPVHDPHGLLEAAPAAAGRFCGWPDNRPCGRSTNRRVNGNVDARVQ